MYSARVQHLIIHVLLRMSTQCVREGAGVHCGLTMETLPDRVPVLPVENYPDPVPEENATRLSPSCDNGMYGLLISALKPLSAYVKLQMIALLVLAVGMNSRNNLPFHFLLL